MSPGHKRIGYLCFFVRRAGGREPTLAVFVFHVHVIPCWALRAAWAADARSSSSWVSDGISDDGAISSLVCHSMAMRFVRNRTPEHAT